MDRSRKELIEELIRVGRLIDPMPNTGQGNSDDAVELSGNAQQSDVGDSSPTTKLKGLPVVDDVVDRPYTTKDMFTSPMGNHESRLSKPIKKQQPEVKNLDSSDPPANEFAGLVVTDPEIRLDQQIGMIKFPIEELARELVTLIADKVNQRSGEQLDDTFRDELTQAVIARLESWLKYD